MATRGARNLRSGPWQGGAAVEAVGDVKCAIVWTNIHRVNKTRRALHRRGNG
jgi:hypothetical protein